MSNSIGEKFKITSFGTSHGVAVGAVVDGCPANLELRVEDIQKELDKRKPGTSSVTTPRKEADEVQILSGIFEGKTAVHSGYRCGDKCGFSASERSDAY